MGKEGMRREAAVALRRPGETTAAFLRAGLRGVVGSSHRSRSAVVIAAMAIAATAALRDRRDLPLVVAGEVENAWRMAGEGRLFDYVDGKLGPSADVIEARASEVAGFMSEQASRLRRGLQRGVEAVDRRVRPEDYAGQDDFGPEATVPEALPGRLAPLPKPDPRRRVKRVRDDAVRMPGLGR